MTWTYEIISGRIYRDNGELIGVGYSGKDPHKNDPDAQSLKDIGPLPVGRYTINPPVDTVTHGPYVMWLTPDPGNVMCGRSGFGIHGDSVVAPGTASEGCIIQARNVREEVWASADRELQVVAQLEDNT